MSSVDKHCASLAALGLTAAAGLLTLPVRG